MLWKIKYLARIKQIAAVLIKYGFQDVVIHLGLGDIFSDSPSSSDCSSVAFISKLSLEEDSDKLALGKQKDADSGPARLKAALQELGTAFIKIGQLLSTRPDLIPETYIDELRNLQDKNDPISYAVV